MASAVNREEHDVRVVSTVRVGDPGDPDPG